MIIAIESDEEGDLRAPDDEKEDDHFDYANGVDEEDEEGPSYSQQS